MPLVTRRTCPVTASAASLAKRTPSVICLIRPADRCVADGDVIGGAHHAWGDRIDPHLVTQLQRKALGEVTTAAFAAA
jgi:hypothetical protein